MKTVILETAQNELEDAVDYYNRESPGLGFEFADEVYRTIDRILGMPDAWQSLTARTRRCLTNRFPYGVIYQVRKNELLVVAIMHLHRKPGVWKQRIRKRKP